MSRLAALVVLAAGLLCAGCDSSKSTPPPASSSFSKATVESPDLEARVNAFCGNCHVVPRPESFPKSSWYAEVRRGYDFYFQSGRRDLSPPAQAEVVEYFRSRAPETLDVAEAPAETAASPVVFRPQVVPAPPGRRAERTAISSLEWLTDNGGSLIATEMQEGKVLQFDRNGQPLKEWPGFAANPATAHPTDLDGDGKLDLVVADLGSFLPQDHDRGRVVVISDCFAESPQSRALVDKVGRVADTCVEDFDGDGLPDLAIGEFGWHTTGSVRLLKNAGQSTGTAATEVLDERPGAIHLRSVDLNNDGRKDFVALISQEYETVVAFLRDGDGFRKEVLYAAPDPAFGSSGIELVDLDQDGDVDILYTCGDTFDSHLVKPYHGVFWLENRGEIPFAEHRLATLPGVHRALAGDFDRDGDLDVVATALLPETVVRGDDREKYDSVIWLEQTTPGVFVRHSLERGAPSHAAAVVGDFDTDGDLDFSVSHFLDVKRPEAVATIFWNEGPPVPAASPNP